MLGLQFTKQGKITEVNKMEVCADVDSSKIKILKVLLSPEDFATLKGDESANYPVIPGRSAIGHLPNMNDMKDFAYLEDEKEDEKKIFIKVFINPVTPCGECVECLSGNTNGCNNFLRAGKETNGYLRDFAVVKNNQIFPLPPTIKDNEAILIDYISLALATIDKLNIQKGEHVAVIGGGLVGLLLTLLIIYYQGVPILIDGDEANLEKARLAGSYYNLFSDNKLEKEVSELTGAHMSQKVAYITDSNINTDVAIKLASYNAKVGFVGFSAPNLKVNFNLAMKKQLDFSCITSGYGYTEQAINIIANKVIDLGVFKIPTYKYEDSISVIKSLYKNLKDNGKEPPIIMIDMML